MKKFRTHLDASPLPVPGCDGAFYFPTHLSLSPDDPRTYDLRGGSLDGALNCSRALLETVGTEVEAVLAICDSGVDGDTHLGSDLRMRRPTEISADGRLVFRRQNFAVGGNLKEPQNKPVRWNTNGVAYGRSTNVSRRSFTGSAGSIPACRFNLAVAA